MFRAQLSAARLVSMIAVENFTTSNARAQTLADVRELLERSFEGGFSPEDWAHTIGGHHVTVRESGALVAHAAVVPRTLHIGDRRMDAGYVEGVATRPDARGRGFGSLAMSELALAIRGLYEIGALSTDRRSFYERLGWESWRGPSYVRDGHELIRTEDEDEGLLVLRFGPSAAVDLTLSIACEARPGDDW